MKTFETPGDIYNATPGRIVFRPGAMTTLPDEAESLGVAKALVISTAGRVGLANRAAGVLGERAADVYPEAISQVPIELARRGREHAAKIGADGLVPVGGGSAIGLAKAIALELGIPIIALPTTYSGSEMTGFCGITVDGVKHMHTDLRMLATTVIYDPELTTSLPREATAASAMNALAHAVDSVYLPTLSPLLRPSAATGAALIAHHLPQVLADPLDLTARHGLLEGAFHCGASLTGGFAVQHGIAHVLGGSLGVEHGLAHALVLPHVTQHLTAFVADTLRPIADALGTDDLPGTFFDLLVESGLPTGLKAVGVARKDLERAVAITLETTQEDSPSEVPLTEDVVRRILDASFDGARPGSV